MHSQVMRGGGSSVITRLRQAGLRSTPERCCTPRRVRNLVDSEKAPR